MPGSRVRKPRVPREGRTVALHVRCTPSEREAIDARARSVSMPLSDYVRVAALHSEVRSKADKLAVLEMAKHAGELGRLGGLLKLWLSERRGDGAPAIAVDQVLADIGATLARLDEAMDRL